MSDTDRRFRRRLLCALALAPWLPAAHANPVGPQVVNGQASIVQQGPTLNITNSPGAVINWQGFSIAPGETTRFIQQNSASSVLNRVVGPDPSLLLGTLTSNGRVYLINPSGILVGEGARIDVPGLVASTLNISNRDFLAGRLNFQPNPGAGTVENRGTITTPSGGSVYLVGSGVTNSGIINSPQGDVILAAGRSVKILDTSTPGVRVEITAGDNAAVNLGQIIARSGSIGIYAATIRNAGVINADQVVRGENGRIFLKASKDATLDAGSSISASGDSGGSVTVQAEQGTLLASGSVAATGADGKGGEIKLLGRLVGLTDHATVDASGSTGGGTVLVGGDAHGTNPDVQNAWRTYVGPDATIKADATASGDGGKVVVWSDDLTRFYGSISATGGPLGGNGGFVETSGHNILDSSGSVDAGVGGQWLLDPFNLTISNLATVGVTGFDAAATGANLLASTIQTALNLGTSVTVTTGTVGSEAGNITVVNGVNINKTSGSSATLILQAAGNIDLQSGSTIQSTAAGNQLGLTLNPGATGTANIAGTVSLNGGTLSIGPSAGGVLSGGTIANATIATTGGTGLKVTSGTLNAVTLRGMLDLSGANSTARILNGLTLLTETGASPGVANVTGNGASLVFDTTGNPTFNNATVNLGSATNSANLGVDGVGTLTLGSGVLVQGTGTIGTQFFVGGAATLINQGTISANLSGRTLTLQGNGVSTFTNQGTLSATGGGTLTLSAANWSNATGGTISANGSTLNFNGNWANAGAVDLTSSTLNLGGTFATAGIGTITRSASTINLTGTLDNTGQILNVGAVPFGVLTMVGGTILGGTVQENSGGLVFNTTGTLNGVTLRGVLDLSGSSNTARILNGLTLLTETGASPGVASVTGNGASLVFDTTGNPTFNDATINLGSATTSGNLGIDGAGTLTLGSGVLVQGSGNIGTQFFLGGAGTLINQGTIGANLNGRTLILQGNGVSSFTNQGTLSATGGGTLTVSAANWSNTRTISANGATLNFNGTWSNAAGAVDLTSSTLNLGGNFRTADIGTVTRTGSTLNLTGTLDNTGATLNVGAVPFGVLTMVGGTILGGTVQENSGGLAFNTSGALNGVTLRGVLDLSGSSNTARILNGLTLLTESGTSPGVANVTGNGASLVFDTTNTSSFNNATINLGSASTSGNLGVDGAGTLTLGSGVLVQGSGNVGTQIFVGGAATLVNQGTISANLSGRTLILQGNGVSSFTNQGTLSAQNGGTLTVSAANWSNASGGTISANGSTLNFNNNWSNAGAVDLTSSTLNLGGSFTTAGIGTITRSASTLNLTGTLNNTGATLNVGAVPFGVLTMVGGTILGGTVQENSGGLAFSTSGTLNGVTLRGVLDLSGNSNTARIQNGLTLLTESGASPGVANVTGNGASLVFDTTSTSSFNNATINLGSASNSGNLGIDGAGTLTLGSGVLVQGSGTIGTQVFVGGTATLINQGTISANLSGRTLTLQGNGVSSFTNQGTLSATNGAALTLSAANWSNATGGTISANGSTLNFNNNWSNAGAVDLNGATLNLGGSFTTAGIGTITRTASTLNLTGTLNNAGQTLNVGAATALGILNLVNGTILGGTVQENLGGLVFNTTGTLNGVTLRGVLDLSGNSNTARILNGLTLLTESGTSPGVANVTGNGASLVFDTTSTSSFNNATINLGSAATSGNLGIDGAGTLTLGSGVLVQGSGTIGTQVFVGGTATLINQGTISANLSGRTLNLQGNGVSSFTNQGTLSAQNGGTLSTPVSFTTNAGIIDIGAGSLVTTNNTSLVNAATGVISGSGTLRLVNAGVTTTRTLTNNGTLAPGGNGGTGTLTIIGDVVLGATSVLQIEIQGTTAGAFDAIAVSGNGQPSVGGAITLGGQLDVAHLAGFTPTGNTPFTILTYVSRVGTTDFTVSSPSGFSYTGAPGLASYVVTAQAAPPNVWQGGLTGDWNVAANWSLGHVPTPTEDVQITLPGATITISAAGQAVRNLTDGETLIILGGGSLAVGSTLTIASGGTLNNGGTLSTNSLVVSGTLNTSGVAAVTGAFSNLGTIDIANAGVLALNTAATNAGTINIALGGSLVVANTNLTNAATGTIAGYGLINLGTGTLINQGTLRTGASPGTLNIVGNLLLTPTSVVQVGIQSPGLTPGVDYDVINVTGTATLDGTLSVTHIGGFTPTSGMNFPVIVYGSHAGAFASISAGGVSYTGTPGSGSFSLALLQGLIQNIFLGNAGNASWDVAANWSLGHVPTAGEDAVIPTGPAFIVIVSAPGDAAHSVTSQQSLTVQSGGALTLGGGNSAISGTLTVAGGTLTNNGSLTTDTFVLNGGAYGGSGNLAVTSAFSHIAGVFNTTGAVAITQASGNLTLSQPLTAGALTINVPGGSLAVQDAVVSSTGAMNVTALGNLNVVAVAAPADLHADGPQTIAANGITVQGAASGAGAARLSSNGGQTITAGTGGITLVSGATGSPAVIDQGGTGNAQLITVSGGVLAVNDGTIHTAGSLTLVVPDIVIGTGSIDAGAGIVTITSTAANGAVSLGTGLSGLGLSNAELGRITAGSLFISGGAISTDGDVAVAGIGNVTLIGSSVQFSNNFSVPGALVVSSTGDIDLTAATTSVLVQAGSAAISGNNITVKGGSANGAFAALQTTSGDVTMSARGVLTLASGAVSNSDAVVLASGSIQITVSGSSSNCSGCTVLPNVTQGTSPLLNVVTDTGLAVGPGGTVIINGVVPPEIEIIPQTTSVAAAVASVKAAETIAAPAGLVIQPVAASPASAPAATDPNGTVGGEAGTFGGAGGGAQGKGGKTAKKANARC